VGERCVRVADCFEITEDGAGNVSVLVFETGVSSRLGKVPGTIQNPDAVVVQVASQPIRGDERSRKVLGPLNGKADLVVRLGSFRRAGDS
jgi:hypothetical protein